MKAIIVRPCSGGFGEYEIPPDAAIERVSRKGARRREDIEGLVRGGGEGYSNPIGRVWELADGTLVCQQSLD